MPPIEFFLGDDNQFCFHPMILSSKPTPISITHRRLEEKKERTKRQKEHPFLSY